MTLEKRISSAEAEHRSHQEWLKHHRLNPVPYGCVRTSEGGYARPFDWNSGCRPPPNRCLQSWTET